MLKEIDLSELRKTKLFVGIPMYGGQCSGLFCKSMNEMTGTLVKYGINHINHYIFNESLVQRARNYIVEAFLQSDCTHLLFIDSDIVFSVNSVLTLLALQFKYPDTYKVLCGPYPKKMIAWEKIVEAVKDNRDTSLLEYYGGDFVLNLESDEKYALDKPIPVLNAGTGFMLIPRDVFQKYDEAYPEQKYTPDHLRLKNFDGSKQIMAYFDTGIDKETNLFLSEDYFFCKKLRGINIPIHICPWISLDHTGQYNYKGSIAALATLNTSLTADKTKL